MGRRLSSALVAAAAGLAAAAAAAAAGTGVAGAAEVLSRPPAHLDGTSVAGSFVAQAAGAACDALEREINAIQSAAAPLASRSTDEAREMPVGDRCFIKFKGSEAVRAAVEALAMVTVLDAEPYGFAAGSTGYWNLDRLDDEDYGDLDGKYSPGYGGAGVNVYVLDSGVDISHPQFEGRARYGANFVEGEPDVDENKHGTHCAGSASGVDVGVAKQATVVSVKVLNSDNGGNGGDFISGVSWAVQEQQRLFPGPNGVPSRPGVISMSILTNQWTPLDDAVRAAQAMNMVVVVAAGNDRQDASERSPANAGGTARSAHGPIVVGASQQGPGEDEFAYFSNYGARIDISAPGRKITSSCLDHKMCSMLGTSMATPHVAGAVAVLLEKHGYDKGAAMTELFDIAAGGKMDMENADINAFNLGEPVPTQTANLLLQVPGPSGPTSPPSPTPKPTTKAPTTKAPTTKAPTPKPTTKAPTTASPTKAPLTGDVTHAPTESPTNSSLTTPESGLADKGFMEENSGTLAVAGAGAVGVGMLAGIFFVFRRRRRQLRDLPHALPSAKPVPPKLRGGYGYQANAAAPYADAPYAAAAAPYAASAPSNAWGYSDPISFDV